MAISESTVINDVDNVLEKVREKTKIKMYNIKIAGMETDDVIQEALIKAYRYLDRYNKKTKIDTYIDLIINSVIKDCFRKAAADKNLNVVNALNIDINDDYNEDDKNKTQIRDMNDDYKVKELMLDIYDNSHLVWWLKMSRHFFDLI